MDTFISILFLVITILLIIYKLVKKQHKKQLNILIIISFIIFFIFIPTKSNNSNKENKDSIKNDSITEKNVINKKIAICSDNDLNVVYLDESDKKTQVKEISHSNNNMFSDYLCEQVKKVAYYYDLYAKVECNKQDYLSTYFRKESIDKVIEYYENHNYKCMFYNNLTKENKDIILGTWCSEDRKYEFKEDGTMIEYIDNVNINGYYSFDGEYIGIAYKYQSYYIGIIKEEMKYENNTLIKGKNIYTKCD